MLFGYTFEVADLAIIASLVMLEGVLSFDNAAILAAMVRRLPVEERRKALLYGLAGAYIFRIGAILAVAFIVSNPIIKVIGGSYLIFLGLRNLIRPHRHSIDPSKGIAARLGISGFWGTVIAIELADLAFALDQVLVAVAMTEKIFLIIIASLVAILFLRISAMFMTRLMGWFPALERLAYLAVGLVGLKLIAVEVARYAGFVDFDIPKEVSMAVTMGLLVLPVVIKVILEQVRRVRPS